MRPALLSAVAAVCGIASLSAQQRAISDSDLFAFRWVASPQISPDGRQVAYVLVTVNAKRDGYETSLWLVKTDGASPPRRITAGPRDGAPRWSPDGGTLAFLRPKDGHPQLHLLWLAGGEAQQLTDLPKGASPAGWSPDGKTIAFVTSTTPEELAKSDKKDESKSDVRIVTQAEFRADDEGYFDPAEHAHIWTVPAGMPGDEPAKAHQVTSGPFDENAPQWSRDGARIYFDSDRVPESYYYPPDDNVYSVPAAGGASSSLRKSARKTDVVSTVSSSDVWSAPELWSFSVTRCSLLAAVAISGRVAQPSCTLCRPYRAVDTIGSTTAGSAGCST